MLMVLVVSRFLVRQGAADAHDASGLADFWSDTVQLMLMMLAVWPVLGHGAADAHDAGCLAGSWSDTVQLMLMMLAVWPVLGQTGGS